MSLLSLPRLPAVALLSVALSLLWGAGTHLHLCFDGLEAPVTLHQLADSGSDLDHHSPEQQHSDSNVDFDASVRGVSKISPSAAALATSEAESSPRVPSTTFLLAVSVCSAVRTEPRFLRPPLRAPPA